MHQVAANQAPGRPGGRGERGGAVPGRPGVGSLGQRVEEGGRRKQGRRPVLVRGGGRAAGDGARGGGPTSTFAAHVCARWAGLAREERASTGRRRRAERRQGMGRAQRRGRALGPPFFAEHNLHSFFSISRQQHNTPTELRPRSVREGTHTFPRLPRHAQRVRHVSSPLPPLSQPPRQRHGGPEPRGDRAVRFWAEG